MIISFPGLSRILALNSRLFSSIPASLNLAPVCEHAPNHRQIYASDLSPRLRISMFNVNCGVLGHIDSGKTSLCRTIHQIASTASMDRNPQSKERGITLDLGFSSLTLPPNDTRSSALQVTLVDCPGHAGLIRTVMNGARIIDMCMLVVDAIKGFQTQTAECLVIAEILSPKLIVVVNKLDMIPSDSRADAMTKLTNRLRKTMGQTRFSENVPIQYISSFTGEGTEQLLELMSNTIGGAPIRCGTGSLHFAFDHCFSVKGQGTVFTGTILSGQIKTGQRIALPYHNETGEVKSIQKFHQSATWAIQGDRIGICVPGINPAGKERGDIYDVKHELISRNFAVFLVKRVKYFKHKLDKGKLHMSIGHLHTMGTPHFFRARKNVLPSPIIDATEHNETLVMELEQERKSLAPSIGTSKNNEFDYIEDIDSVDWNTDRIFCLILFQGPIKFSPDSLLIASKLDLEENHPGCRLAFYGLEVHFSKECISQCIQRTKIKEGQVERLHGNDGDYLVKGIMKKGDTDASKYIGRCVYSSDTIHRGTIEGPFGKSGLLKVHFDSPLADSPIGSTVCMPVNKPAFAKLIL